MDAIKDQEIFILIALGITLMLSMAITLIAFYNRSQRRILNEKLDAQERILHEVIMAQEEERNRIAQELHDDVGSKLNVAHLHIQRLKKKLPGDTLELIEQVINITIDTTRRISHELLPPTLEKFGLEAALEELKEGYETTGFLQFDMQIEDLGEAVTDNNKALNLFRIVQELVKNSLLHGESKNVSLHFLKEKEAYTFQYKDDGKGFDKEKATKGLGMNNIESRLKMVDGSWEYHSAPGKGLKAEISFS
ncbi:MAG: histidine kinase [Bacteroidota bacterium]